MSLEIQRGRLACAVVPRHVQLDAVPRRDARVALGRQLRPRAAEREVDVEENCAELGQPGATGVGQRYAFACRFASDGSLARMPSRWPISSSAEMTVSSSGACATTSPQGSTISERPYAGSPGRVSTI